MAVSATDVISPMLTAPKVVVLFSAGMAAKARLRGFFRRLGFEGNDLRRITFLQVGLAGSMTLFTTRHLALPTAQTGKLCMSNLWPTAGMKPARKFTEDKRNRASGVTRLVGGHQRAMGHRISPDREVRGGATNQYGVLG